MTTSIKNISAGLSDILTKKGSLRQKLAILAVSLLLPSAVSAQCLTATTSNGWQNAVMTSQTGTFTATFDATPSASPTNSVIALSNGAQTAYANFACLARFNPTGDIDARNGGAYAAASTIPYSAGVSYHFRLAVNIPAQTYSIYVTPAGGSELTVGLNYAFRISDTTLNWYGVFVDSGSGGAGTVTVCNFSTGNIPTFTITPSAGSGGSISPSSTVTVNQGGNQTFTITPNSGFLVAGVSVDGVSQGALTTYTFSNVQSNHTISASFNPVPQFTITASAGTNGSISPSGTITVNQGASQSFTIAANSGFVVSSVLVDGASQGTITSYTFSNVQTNHTISATFAAGNTCTNETGTTNTALSSAQSGTFTATWDATPSISGINATMSLCSGSQTAYASYSCIARFFTSGDIDSYNGTGYASASTIPYSGGTTYHFEMDVNVTAHTYSIYVTPAGGSKTLVGSNYAFRSTAGSPISLNTFNVDISGSGAVNICNLTVGTGTNFTIAASAGSGGSINPSGNVLVSQGGNQSFTITPNSGFNVSSVTVDGANQGAITSFTFSNVQANHTISAAFAPVPTFTLTASAGSGGSINPFGTVTVNQGANQTFTITPNSGFTVSSVTVDGASVGAVSTYTFSNVQANHTISAAFAPVPTYTITASAGSNGSISPSGTVTVNQGASQAFTITPNSGFTVSSVTVDGTNVGALTSYTFSNVQANHTISAAFAQITYTITASAGSGGSINPSGTVTVNQGASQAFTITANSGFTASVTVDGINQGAITSYTFSNVQANHTISAAFSNGGFIHPGVSVNKAELDLIKSRVAQGIEPQASAFSAAQSSSVGSLTYTPHPWQTVNCGQSSNPDFGCTDEKNDTAAAYTQALLWYITGNTTYAQNAVKIMNAWSSTLTGGHTNANTQLEAAWTGGLWPRAAEIMVNSGYTGWAASDIARFKNMLVTQYMPYVNEGCNNGNWEESELEAKMNMAVFLDDHTSFNQAVTAWRHRTPALFYLTTDGSTPLNSGSCGARSWYTTTYHNGQEQETCRDSGHMQYGVASCLNSAMTARQQGVDLFGEQQTRLVTGMEYNTAILNGGPVPCSTASGPYSGTWIIGYNYYHNVLGINMPQSAQANTKAPNTADHMMVWERLTHGDVGSVGLPPITTP
jgi:hypothetical protein